MIEIIADWLCPPYPVNEARIKAKEILNATRPCKECGGLGKTLPKYQDCELACDSLVLITCPSCKGTGGTPLLYLSAENQEPPYNIKPRGLWVSRVHESMFKYMTTPVDCGDYYEVWVKVKKVKVQE